MKDPQAQSRQSTLDYRVWSVDSARVVESACVHTCIVEDVTVSMCPTSLRPPHHYTSHQWEPMGLQMIKIIMSSTGTGQHSTEKYKEYVSHHSDFRHRSIQSHFILFLLYWSLITILNASFLYWSFFTRSVEHTLYVVARPRDDHDRDKSVMCDRLSSPLLPSASTCSGINSNKNYQSPVNKKEINFEENWNVHKTLYWRIIKSSLQKLIYRIN